MILFAAFFPPDRIFGGVRTIYRQVEALNRNGVEAAVLNPLGHPTWFKSEVPVIRSGGLSFEVRDAIVFPEAFTVGDPITRQLLQMRASRHVFCQSYLYALNGIISERTPQSLGITSAYACSSTVARFLREVFGFADVPVVPCMVDTTVFRPGLKTPSIAYMPRRLPETAELIRKVFLRRHPSLSSVPWRPINGRTEEETAEILSTSAVFLSLSHQEGFGLPPLEAMASGCVVVGFHGGGGREYATASNGLWTDPDDIVATADALALAVKGFEAGNSLTLGLIENGRVTATSYSQERMERALLQYFRKP